MVLKMKSLRCTVSILVMLAMLIALSSGAAADVMTGTIDQLSYTNFGNDVMAQTFKTPDSPITVTGISLFVYTNPDNFDSFVKVKIAIEHDYNAADQNFGTIVQESDEKIINGQFNGWVTFDFNAPLDANCTYSIVTSQSIPNPSAYYPLNSRIYLGPTDACPDGMLYRKSIGNWLPYEHPSAYHDLNFQITYNYGDQSDVQPANNDIYHEFETMLTNPADGSGVRTTNLNYYLRDPVIWKNDVKSVKVWLETKVIDLAKAKEYVQLLSGQTLLKDYDIRLMMRIEYIDGRAETKEVDRADIARNIPVFIPVDEFNSNQNLGVVFIDTNGNTAILPVTLVTIDGYKFLRFENNHFSEYGIIAKAGDQSSYTVKAGDTLTRIARQFGVKVKSLVDLNKIKNPDMIYIGQVLMIG